MDDIAPRTTLIVGGFVVFGGVVLIAVAILLSGWRTRE